MLSIVVRGFHTVAFDVTQLSFNSPRVPPVLVQERCCHTAEPVSGKLPARVSECPKGIVDCEFTHRALPIQLHGKQESSVPCPSLELAQNIDRLVAQRNDVRPSHLHEMRRY